jgi:hypothetical protein
MKLTASQLRQIIKEEVTRALREAAGTNKYAAAARALLASGTDDLGPEDLEASGLAFLEVFKDAVATFADDAAAVEAEKAAALGALQAAGATPDDLENVSGALDVLAIMVAADLRDQEDTINYELRNDQLRGKIEAAEAAREAVIGRLAGDRSFMATVVPLMNSKIAAKSSKDKTAASKAVTAAIAAAMTDEELETVDPVRVHGAMFDRLQSHARRKAGR